MLRLLVTPRWIGWTLFALAAVVVCGLMAWWQVVRAESPGGSLLNAGYAFQWPLFGLFFAALWWRMLRAEAKALAEVRAADELTQGRVLLGAVRQHRHQRPHRYDDAAGELDEPVEPYLEVGLVVEP